MRRDPPPVLQSLDPPLQVIFVQRDSSEVFYEAVNDNSAWKMILFKTIREIGFVCEMGESSVYYVR